MKVNLDVHMSYYHNKDLLHKERKQESVEEYLARGGRVTVLPPASKSDPSGTSVQAIREALRIYKEREAAQAVSE